MSETNDLKLELLQMIEELPQAQKDNVRVCIALLRKTIKDYGNDGILAMSLVAVGNQE